MLKEFYLLYFILGGALCHATNNIVLQVHYKLSDLYRIRRQAGYIYNKPNIAFNLPSAQSTSTSPEPSSIRTQAQQMYYAYPVPSSSASGSNDVVNIGFSSTASTGAPGSTTGTSGYNYETQRISSNNGGNSGSYASTVTAGVLTQSAPRITGYGYGTPSPTSTVGSTSLLTSNVNQGISTNAPTYLPPTANVGNVQESSSASSNSRGTSTIVEISDSYSPPMTSGSTQGSSVTSSLSQGNSADTGYLPPRPIINLAPTASPSLTGYPSPVSSPSPSGPGSVSTPAPTYLPPRF